MAIADFVVVVSLIGGAILIGAIYDWFVDWRLLRSTRRRLSPGRFRKPRRAA